MRRSSGCSALRHDQFWTVRNQLALEGTKRGSALHDDISTRDCLSRSRSRGRGLVTWSAGRNQSRFLRRCEGVIRLNCCGHCNDRSPLPATVDDHRGQRSLLHRQGSQRPRGRVRLLRAEPGRGSAAKLLTKDEAQRIAANIVKLPELLRQQRRPLVMHLFRYICSS